MKILTAAFAALMFIACNSKNQSSEKGKDSGAAMLTLTNSNIDTTKANSLLENEIATADTIAAPQENQKQKEPPKNLPQAKTDWDKKIIKTASLNAEVKDYNVFYSSLREKIKNLGGYIAQEEQNQSLYKIENSLVVKVPVDQFDNALAQLSAGTDKINERKITSQDVTTEVVDTKSRMEAKKQVRQRYIDLLKQAKNMEEVLSVQTEINGIQEDIESAAGRINYLSHSSSYSTINLTFFQVLNASAVDNEEPSFFTKISSSFKTGWHWTGDLIVGFVSIWPLILFILLIWIVIKKNIRPKVKTQNSIVKGE